MWFGTQTPRDAKRAGTRSLVNPLDYCRGRGGSASDWHGCNAAESRVQVNYLTCLRRPCKSGSKGLPDGINDLQLSHAGPDWAAKAARQAVWPIQRCVDPRSLNEQKCIKEENSQLAGWQVMQLAEWRGGIQRRR
jgi:hypothetical protein